MRESVKVVAGLALATGLAATPAKAVTMYTDLASWEAAVSSWSETTSYGSNFSDISSYTLNGGVTVAGDTVEVLQIGNGWSTWSGGYTGQVLWTLGSDSYDGSLSGSVKGFGLFAEPNPFATYSITLETSGGSVSQLVNGSGGAAFFGWVGPGVTSFEVSSSVDFAIGDHFVSSGVPEPSTWAMMLVGFAGLSFAAYRRKVASLAAA